MNIRCFLYTFLAIFLFVSCQQQDVYFDNITYFDITEVKTDTIKGQPIHFDDIYTGNMFVYDSLITFTSHKYPDYLLSVFRITDGKHLMNGISKGNGKDEFMGINLMPQIIIDSDRSPKYWLYAYTENKIIQISYEQLSKNPQNIIDTVIPINPPKGYNLPFYYLFRLDSTRMLVKTYPEIRQEKGRQLIQPSYQIIQPENGEIIRQINLYKPSLQKVVGKEPEPTFFYLSNDQIKPDTKKIANVMAFLHQINILDLESGTVQSIRAKGTPKTSDVLQKSFKDSRLYYKSMCVDNNYIYTLLVNKPIDLTNSQLPSSKEILIFDWSGNPIKRLILAQEIDQIRLDLANHLLYGKNETTDEVYLFPLGS